MTSQERLTPEDSLWLTMLDRDPELGNLPAEEIRSRLSTGGFPERVIDTFVARQAPYGRPPG